MPESTGSSALSPSHPRSKKRRQHSPDATRRIVAANFSNEIDALEILANAAADPDSDDQKHVSPDEEPQKGIRWDIQEDQVQAKGLEDYCLVKENVLTVNDLENLVRIFFENHHPVLVGPACHVSGLSSPQAHLPDGSDTEDHPAAR